MRCERFDTVQLDDAEFWDFVFNGLKPGESPAEPEPDDETVEDFGGPCDACGAIGACGYDDQGRPLIHPTYVADE